jgi:hypothetical protein
VALTSHSGFGELLLPYDNIATFSRALAPLRFALDRRTGAIVVDDSGSCVRGIADAGSQGRDDDDADGGPRAPAGRLHWGRHRREVVEVGEADYIHDYRNGQWGGGMIFGYISLCTFALL